MQPTINQKLDPDNQNNTMAGKRKNAAAARGVSPSPSGTASTTSASAATVTTKVAPKESAPPIATTTNVFATSTQIEPTTTTTSTSTSTTPKSSGASKSSSSSIVDKGALPQAWNKVFSNLLTHYQNTTPQRTKLLDAFMAFLVVVGGLQFLYCVLAGNYVRFSFFLSLRLRLHFTVALHGGNRYGLQVAVGTTLANFGAPQK